MSALLDRLRSDGPAISQAVLEEQYRDPFWRARFGDKGRRHANEDSAFHLQYLSRAVTVEDASVLVRYAVWLREVLASRGMCSRHLAENFRLLAIGIDAQHWPDGERAAGYVREAQAALDHATGDAATLQRARPALVAQAASERPGRNEMLANLLSYLEDSLAFAAPAQWHDHIAWTAGWLEQTTGTREALVLDLAALGAALERAGMPAAAREAVRAAGAKLQAVEAR